MKEAPQETKRKKTYLHMYPIEGDSVEEAKKKFFARGGKVEKQPAQVDPNIDYNYVPSKKDGSGYSSIRDKFNGIY